MRVEVNLDAVQRKLSAPTLQRGQYALLNQALADMNRYVPMDQGHLRMAAKVEPDATGVTYTMPYASNQFYTQMGNYTTPGTGPRWDLKASSMHMKEWEDAYKKGAGWT